MLPRCNALALQGWENPSRSYPRSDLSLFFVCEKRGNVSRRVNVAPQGDGKRAIDRVCACLCVSARVRVRQEMEDSYASSLVSPYFYKKQCSFFIFCLNVCSKRIEHDKQGVSSMIN